MNNWILAETENNIRSLINSCKNYHTLCEMQLKHYKDKYNTTDMHEACSFEYWIANKIRITYEIKDLEDLLEQIRQMKIEEVKEEEAAEEDIRINKHDNYLGI